MIGVIVIGVVVVTVGSDASNGCGWRGLMHWWGEKKDGWEQCQDPKCNLLGFSSTGAMTDPTILPFNIRTTSINATCQINTIRVGSGKFHGVHQNPGWFCWILECLSVPPKPIWTPVDSLSTKSTQIYMTGWTGVEWSPLDSPVQLESIVWTFTTIKSYWSGLNGLVCPSGIQAHIWR